ncbi:LOW QUALITY PROTEIN: syntabulin-like [Theristicus caerulescens]
MAEVSLDDVIQSESPTVSARTRGPDGRNTGSLRYKSRASPPASRGKDPVSAVCKTQLSPANVRPNYGASSASSSNSGSYRRSGRSLSCGDNPSIKPENPEQCLTPLQQKETTVRHLKAKLKESESKRQEREREIGQLKAQLRRMKEDWLEEECNHVETELAFLEARREVKELQRVIESMKKSLAEKDKTIEKYFVGISTENKKLESLLQRMEMARNSSERDEQCLEDTCASEGKPSALPAMVPDSSITGDQALEELADSGLLLNEEEEKVRNVMVEQAVQTDVVPYSLDVEQLIQTIFSAQDACPLSPPSSLNSLGEFSLASFSDSGILVDLTPRDPSSAILLSPLASPCRKVEHGVNENRFVKELDFPEPRDAAACGYVKAFSQAGVKRRYWHSSLLAEVFLLAAPFVPTLLWAFSAHRGGRDPISSVGALLCGCGLVYHLASDYLTCAINRFKTMFLVSK